MHRLLLLIALLPASLAARAQTTLPAPKAFGTQASPTNAQARADALTANMAQALALTPAQVEKVRAINVSSVRNVEAARQHFATNPGKLRAYIEDVGAARVEQLKDVLTPVQFARYQQKREEKMGIPKPGSSQGNPPPGLPGGE